MIIRLPADTGIVGDIPPTAPLTSCPFPT